MSRGQYVIATHYAVGEGRYSTAEKSYWNKSTADSHFNATRDRDGINALVMYDPNGRIVRSWNRARE